VPNLKRVISDLNRRKQRGFEQKQAKETKAWRRERASQPGLANELSVGVSEITEGSKRI
jgi:hypothetical protein